MAVDPGSFHDFDPQWVADLSSDEIDQLATDPRVIRNRRKIEATAANAKTLLELDRTNRGFRRYLRSFPDFDKLSTDLQKQFRFLGNTGAYHFLWSVGESVPAHEDWANSAKSR
jgi:DNA-3-methyladenine glycosylase I